MSSDMELYGDNTRVATTPDVLKIFEEVDAVVGNAVANESIEGMLSFGRALRQHARLSGVALAKLLWCMKDNWGIFESRGIDDDFLNVVEAEIGIKASTATVYVRTWETLFANPDISDETKEQLLGLPIRTLKLLPSLVHEGDAVNWDDILSAGSHDGVRRVIKRIRGEATSSKTALFISMDLRTGQLSAKRGDGFFEPFGVLSLQNKSPVIVSAVERLVSGGRIMLT